MSLAEAAAALDKLLRAQQEAQKNAPTPVPGSAPGPAVPRHILPSSPLAPLPVSTHSSHSTHSTHPAKTHLISPVPRTSSPTRPAHNPLAIDIFNTSQSPVRPSSTSDDLLASPTPLLSQHCSYPWKTSPVDSLSPQRLGEVHQNERVDHQGPKQDDTTHHWIPYQSESAPQNDATHHLQVPYHSAVPHHGKALQNVTLHHKTPHKNDKLDNQLLNQNDAPRHQTTHQNVVTHQSDSPYQNDTPHHQSDSPYQNDTPHHQSDSPYQNDTPHHQTPNQIDISRHRMFCQNDVLLPQDEVPSQKDAVYLQTPYQVDMLHQNDTAQQSDPLNQSDATLDQSDVERDPFTPMDPEKYKTELCRSYQVHGFCRYGARCNFAHGLQQLRGSSHHGKYKTRNCQSYHQMGFCRYGARCSFIHDPEEGVLKCSIANKEVLEALHYIPASEETCRTANITWRLLDSPSGPVPELHLITSSTTRSLEDDLAIPAPVLPRATPIPPRSSPITLARSATRRTLIEEPRFLSSSLPARHSDFASPLLQDRDQFYSYMIARKTAGSRYPNTSYGPGKLHMFSQHGRQSIVSKRIGFQDGGAQTFTSQQHFSVAKFKDCNAPEIHAKTRPNNRLHMSQQELLKLEVVQNLLKNGPKYSATHWSDGSGDDPTSRIPKVVPSQTARSNCVLSHSYSHTNNRQSVGPKRERVESCSDEGGESQIHMKGEEEKNVLAGEQLSPPHSVENVLSSTLRSDSEVEENKDEEEKEQEEEEEEKHSSMTGNDSRRSSHKTDVLQSLEIQEYHYQVMSRRYSDGSLFSPSQRHLQLASFSPSKQQTHDLAKYKTELCRSYQNNAHCPYGEACLYAHGSLDLRSYPKHPMFRTKQCFSFHNKGFCLYGNRCQFLHDVE